MNKFNLINQRIVVCLILITSTASLLGGRTRQSVVTIKRAHKKIPVIFQYYVGTNDNPLICLRQPMQHTSATLDYKNFAIPLTDFSGNVYPISFCTNQCQLAIKAKNNDVFSIKQTNNGIVIHNETRGFSTRILNCMLKNTNN